MLGVFNNKLVSSHSVASKRTAQRYQFVHHCKYKQALHEEATIGGCYGNLDLEREYYALECHMEDGPVVVGSEEADDVSLMVELLGKDLETLVGGGVVLHVVLGEACY